MRFLFLLSFPALFITNWSIAQLPATSHAPPAGVPTSGSTRLNDLQTDANNIKWVCFASYGLGEYDGTNWTIYNTGNSGIPSDSVICIDFDNSGNAWIGSGNGAAYKAGNIFTVYNTGNSGLPSDVITAVLNTGSTTWFGTLNGLASFDGLVWNLYNTSNSGLENDSITCLAENGSGDLWIGTRNGLTKYSSGNWTNYNTQNSQLSRYIIDLVCDDANKTWITCGELYMGYTVSTSGIYFIESMVVKNFKGDFYTYDLDFSYINNAFIARDNIGRIYFYGKINNRVGIYVINDGEFDFYYSPFVPMGVNFGNLISVDNNGLLWALSKGFFYFYSLEFSGYVYTFDYYNINFLNHRHLNINEVTAAINVSGDMHWDFEDPGYEVPKGTGKTSVFTSALWIGGLDQGGQLHIAAQTYRQTGQDFWPGPIDGLSMPMDSSTSIQFDRIWKMDKWKIEQFKSEFLAGNVSNGTYPVPEEIDSWPSKGNGIVTGDIAPFVDFNNDGAYNPMDGDYPEIKGDQMLFYIFNDSLFPHTESDGKILGIQVHASAYSFYCPGINDSSQVLNRTTLYNYKIINRSLNDYNGVYIGLWADCDLGNSADDYVGCDSTLAAGFTYNGDNDDQFQLGYGLNPPMQNVVVLRGVLADPFDGDDNDLDGIIDEPGERTTMNHFQYYNSINNSPTSNPIMDYQYYNYMKSIWLDSLHVTYGGDGRDLSAAPVNFMFSGIPYSGAGWSEITAGNPPEDRRMLLSSGPFSLDSHDTVTIDFAYVFTWDSLNPNGLLTSIARNQADIQRVRNWFDNNNFPSCLVYSTALQEPVENREGIYVYPNPVSDKLIVRNQPDFSEVPEYSVFNTLGEEVMKGELYSGYINVESLVAQVYVLMLKYRTGLKNISFIKN